MRELSLIDNVLALYVAENVLEFPLHEKAVLRIIVENQYRNIVPPHCVRNRH